jgi:hypothetical protein
VDHILKEGATAVYQANRSGDRDILLRNILDKARDQIVKRVGIGDPELTVNLDIEEKRATLTADYHVLVKHPVGGYTTLLHFHRQRSADIGAVEWE